MADELFKSVVAQKILAYQYGFARSILRIHDIDMKVQQTITRISGSYCDVFLKPFRSIEVPQTRPFRISLGENEPTIQLMNGCNME